MELVDKIIENWEIITLNYLVTLLVMKMQLNMDV